MAERTKLKEIDLSKYRWLFIIRGIILLTFGLLGIIIWPFISMAGTGELLGVYVGMIFISEGLMTMAISIFIRELKYWWVPVVAGLVSLLSAAIILLARERSDIVNYAIGGWSIFKALLALMEEIIIGNMVKRIFLLYVKNFFLILIAPLVILSLTFGPKYIALCIAYYFIIHGSNHIILSFFDLKNLEPSQSGGAR